MSTYYSLPTQAGLDELAGALAERQDVPFTHIAIGDGNGSPVVPDGRVDLVHQVDKVPVVSIRQHPGHANWVVFEAAIPEDRGGYTIRELALIGGRKGGKVMAVGNYPTTEKPAPDSGAASGIVVRMVVAYTNAAAVSLAVDPQAYITLQTVLDKIAQHEAKVDPHPQYLTKAEGDYAYDPAGAAGNGLAAHVAAVDPHPQYINQAELDIQFAGHLNAHDPHPQYLNAARAAAAWAEQFFYAAGT